MPVRRADPGSKHSFLKARDGPVAAAIIPKARKQFRKPEKLAAAQAAAGGGDHVYTRIHAKIND